jgi:hypothetical protein
VGEWLRRYLPAEIVGLIVAVVAASVAQRLTDGNAAIIALVGAWAETLAYYATMLVRELLTTRGTVLEKVRDLVLEFGVGEAIDTLVIRPALMYAAGQLVHDPRWGVVIGKFASDVFFYVPTIAAYELRKRYLPRAVPPDAHGALLAKEPCQRETPTPTSESNISKTS